MDLSSVEDLQTALQLAGIRPQKGLGQHFLIDRPSLDAVMGAAGLQPDDVVLEVGPGLGVMTEALASQVKRVIAVETDRVLVELLRRRQPANLEIVEADIRQFNLGDLPSGYKVVANIPYYLTSQLIRLLLESTNPPKLMSLLIQKEVAERIVAGPGSLSILALSVQYYGHPEIRQLVERHKFWPAPKVDSAILRVEVNGPVFTADPPKLFRLIKAGFGEKRKQLKNALAGGLNTSGEVIDGWLAEAGIGQTARAQELSLADWQRLYTVVVKAEGL